MLVGLGYGKVVEGVQSLVPVLQEVYHLFGALEVVEEQRFLRAVLEACRVCHAEVVEVLDALGYLSLPLSEQKGVAPKKQICQHLQAEEVLGS